MPRLTIERRLLRKLDMSLLIFSVLGLIMRYVDQTNLATACMSRVVHRLMDSRLGNEVGFSQHQADNREDLQMYGLEYNYCVTAWSVLVRIVIITDEQRICDWADSRKHPPHSFFTSLVSKLLKTPDR